MGQNKQKEKNLSKDIRNITDTESTGLYIQGMPSALNLKPYAYICKGCMGFKKERGDK